MDDTELHAALMRLRAIPIDRAAQAAAMAPQEMVDVLAMMAGFKPVYVLGQGYNDPAWLAGVLDVARKAGLHIIEGPMWSVATGNNALPSWFRDYMATEQQGSVRYLCRGQEAANAVRTAIANSPITIEEEARLLGYPPCCVQARYERDALFDQVFYKVLERNGHGDISTMKRLLDDDVDMAPETPDEEALLDEATRIVRAPFTSINMCSSCTDDEASQAMGLSGCYEDYVRGLDEGFASEIAASAKDINR